MSEWWTYRLSDLLMFSAKTYYRLFERYNTDLWPAQLLTLAIGIYLIICALGGSAHGRRVAVGLLAACWLWVAWAFHWKRYASINLAAPYFAIGFALQALLLLWSALHSRVAAAAAPAKPARIAAAGLLVWAVLVYPWAALLYDRPWQQMEIFGIAPDPTAVATLGWALLHTRFIWWLVPIPLAWCAISGATLHSMGTPGGWQPVVAVLMLLLAIPLRHAPSTLAGRPHR